MNLKDAYNLGKELLSINTLSNNNNFSNQNIIKSKNISYLDIRLLLQHILSINDLNFLIKQDLLLTQEQIKRFKDLVSLRKTGYPLAYILGYKNFWKNKYFVNEHVLIPRPDTEILVESILDVWKKYYKSFVDTIKILDIGTGSGCILLSLLQEIPNSVGVGSDISKEALLVVKKNIENLNINPKKVFLLQQNLFSALNTKNKFDFIVSNPPYISYTDNLIQDDVKTFEPNIALFASHNGLFFYKHILQNAANYLKKTGYLFLEIGINQKNEILKLSESTNLKFKKSILDYNSIERVLIFTL